MTSDDAGEVYTDAFYAALDTGLDNLLRSFELVIPRDDIAELREYFDHGEYGITMEFLVCAVLELGAPVSEWQRGQIDRLAQYMDMDDEIPGHIGLPADESRTAQPMITAAKLVTDVAALDAGIDERVEMILDDNDREFLPHLIFGEITRWALETFDSEPERVHSLLRYFDGNYDAMSLAAQNVVDVSFVENLNAANAVVDALPPRFKAMHREMYFGGGDPT